MLPSTPPSRSEAVATLREGSHGWPVYALQSALNDAAGATLTTDGVFGGRTTTALVAAQRSSELPADGVCGPRTWRALADRVCRRVDRDIGGVPDGLARRFARGEGGDYGSAVNWSVAGGVDCGLFQLRCYGPPYVNAALVVAFAPVRAGLCAMRVLADRAARFAHPHVGCPFAPLELAVLAHNFPWAADQYYRYGHLPEPSKPAPWVPASLPASARTYEGWCFFYVHAMTG